jgi:hypothetical protein
MHQGTSTVRPFPNLSQSVLDRTVEVLRQAEHLLIKRSQVRWKKAEVVLDSVWHGPSFVLMGLGAQAQLAGLAVVMLLVWWVALVAISAATEHTLRGWGGMGVPAAVMAMASIVFRMPSTGTLHGVRRTAVVLLAAHIREVCPDEGTLMALKANLSSLAEVSEKHGGRIQAILGLYWAALVWWVATWVLPVAVPQATRNEASGWAFLGAVFFILAGAMTIGYATASRIFWQTINLAISEMEAGTVQIGTALPDGVRLIDSKRTGP